MLTVVIPVYNEAESLPTLHAELAAVLVDHAQVHEQVRREQVVRLYR